MVIGLRVFAQRTGDGAGQPVLDEDSAEEFMHLQPSVSVVLGNRPAESPGTLYITSRKVIWLSDEDREKGYAVDFLSISLHAVSRDPEAYSSPCIYTQIEAGEDDEESEDSDSESSKVVDLAKIREMRLVPQDATQLDTLFEVFCECAVLIPEPFEEDEEEGHNWVFTADQMVGLAAEDDETEWQISQSPTSVIGHSNGDHGLAQSVLELRINDHRFEDADETVHGKETT